MKNEKYNEKNLLQNFNQNFNFKNSYKKIRIISIRYHFLIIWMQ